MKNGQSRNPACVEGWSPIATVIGFIQFMADGSLNLFTGGIHGMDREFMHVCAATAANREALLALGIDLEAYRMEREMQLEAAREEATKFREELRDLLHDRTEACLASHSASQLELELGGVAGVTAQLGLISKTFEMEDRPENVLEIRKVAKAYACPGYIS
jgi:hypothetical protein